MGYYSCPSEPQEPRQLPVPLDSLGHRQFPLSGLLPVHSKRTRANWSPSRFETDQSMSLQDQNPCRRYKRFPENLEVHELTSMSPGSGAAEGGGTVVRARVERSGTLLVS